MSSLFKNIFIVLGIALTAGIGYYLYTQNGYSDSTANNTAVDNSIALETANFLNSLNELESIHLDGTIFTDPRFISLTSYAVPVQAQQIGRPNPFSVN